MADSNHIDILLLGYEDEENLGLRYIAAYLKNNGLSVDIIPIPDLDKQKLLNLILLINPKIIGFSMMFQQMLPEFTGLISFLRKNGIKCHFNMGGHFPTIEYEKTLKIIPELDSIIRHEGELTFLELYNHIDKPEEWFKIKGLAFRRDGRIQVTTPRPLIQDLDNHPFPIRSGPIHAHRGLGILSLITSRGCYYDCSFCSIQEFYRGAPGPRRRSRSPENVVMEMIDLFNAGTRIFIFKDDDFCMNRPSQKQWIRRFVDGLEDSHLRHKILWRISSRIDEIDAEMLEILKNAGLGFLYLGIESGNDKGLETCNKHYKVEKIYETLRILESVDINFEYGFMVFDPESSFSSIKENIYFLNELCKDGRVVVHFTKMTPYVGTQIAQRLEKEGRLEGSESSPDYKFNDSRIDLLETFFNMTFYHILFNGLVNKLQFAKYDAIIMEKFFKGAYDTKTYKSEVRRLTNIFNESILKTMEMAVDFMERRSEKEILQDWSTLEILADKKLFVHPSISQAIDNLIPDESILL
ncbi:MAG: B12-binding domain-containing radical SAM protein [ANME-2 cluster archaeon]|nr:MAG: B12-binding domain-containing radical SAM protein [ANME-2 cluster archaeon]